MGNLWRLQPADRNDVMTQVIAYPGAWHAIALSLFFTIGSQAQELTIQDSAQAQVMDGNLALTGNVNLTIQDSAQAQVMDSIALVMSSNLSIQDSGQEQAMDGNLALETIAGLSVAETASEQVSDEVVLTVEHQLNVEDSAGGSESESIVLTQGSMLVVQDSEQGQNMDGEIPLSVINELFVFDSLVVQMSDQVVWEIEAETHKVYCEPIMKSPF